MRESTYYATPSEKQNQKRQEEILMFLQEGEKSAEEILDHFEDMGIRISLPSLKKDMCALRKNGYEIRSRKKKYYLSGTAPEGPYISHNRNDYRDIQAQFLVLQDLQDGEKGYQDLNYLENTIGFSSGYMHANVLGALKSDGLITFNSKKYSRNFQYFITELPDQNSLFEILANSLSLSKKATDLAIKRLTSEYFIDSEKERSILYEMPLYMKTLKQAEYTKSPVSFRYAGKNNKMITVNCFLVGIIAYSVENDEIYIVGRTTLSPNKKQYLTVKASSVVWDSLDKSSQLKNFQKYCSNRIDYLEQIHLDFEQIKHEMFAISPEEPRHIKVKIEYSKDREKEFTILTNNRSETASLEKDENGDLIYTDTIRGMSDMARFLRKFGASVSVLEDDTLKTQMKKTAENVLKEYGVTP